MDRALEYTGAHAIGYFESRCIVASPYTMNRPKRFVCFSLIIELSFLHKFNSSMSSLLGAFDFPNHYVPCILWIKHVGRISPSIFSLFSGGGGGGRGGGISRYCPLLISWSFLWLTRSSLSIRRFWGNKKREVKRGGERAKGEKQLSLLPLPPLGLNTSKAGERCVLLQMGIQFSLLEKFAPLTLPRRFFIISHSFSQAFFTCYQQFMYF